MSVSELENALVEAVRENIDKQSSVAVAFSGGVDSSLLAQLCKLLGINVALLTVGFPGSIDIEFSKVIATKLDLPHMISELEKEDFHNKQTYVRQKLNCKNVSHIENCLAFFYLGLLARENGIRLILTANGCDELFCGYDRFRSIYELGNDRIKQFIDKTVENEMELINEIKYITAEFGVETKHPFLSEKIRSVAMRISIAKKINGCNDYLRKHILREVSLAIGVPEEAAMRPKKALQYGSLIHKILNSAANNDL